MQNKVSCTLLESKNSPYFVSSFIIKQIHFRWTFVGKLRKQIHLFYGSRNQFGKSHTTFTSVVHSFLLRKYNTHTHLYRVRIHVRERDRIHVRNSLFSRLFLISVTDAKRSFENTFPTPLVIFRISLLTHTHTHTHITDLLKCYHSRTHNTYILNPPLLLLPHYHPHSTFSQLVESFIKYTVNEYTLN